jgi:hypothetical protein
MKRRAVVALGVLLAGSEGADTGVHWQFERMLVQPRYEAYRASPFFIDGRAMRTPPPGTVPHDEPHAATGGRAESSDAATIPLPLSRALLERGRRRFDITCATCHGLDGDGESAVGRRMRFREPPSLHSEENRAASAGRLFAVVREGYGLMPSYAPLLSVEDSWAVVAYVRALQLSRGARLDELPPALREEALGRLGRAGPGPGGAR